MKTIYIVWDVPHATPIGCFEDKKEAIKTAKNARFVRHLDGDSFRVFEMPVGVDRNGYIAREAYA